MRVLWLTALLLAAPALAHDPGSRPSTARSCHRWYRPDQRRDTLRDAPEYHPRLPHQRSAGAGRQRGYPPPRDEDRRRHSLAQGLSPADDDIGYRGLCELHHSGPPCPGDNRPLPAWVPDSPDELSWERPILSLGKLARRR